MGDSNLRVVRLAPRESRLLNSRCGTGVSGCWWWQQVAAAEAEGVPGCVLGGRTSTLCPALTCRLPLPPHAHLICCREKAPFTLCVEVLDEQEAAVVAEAKAAAAAAAAAAAVAEDAKASSGSGSGKQYADSANSLLADQAPALQMMQPPALDDEAAAAAAADAAAHGIKFFANHHRTQSMDASSASSLEAAALAAVQGSSAVTGDAVSATAAMSARRGSSRDPSRPSSPRDSVRSGGSSSHPADLLSSEPSLAAMLGSGEASPTPWPPGDARGAAGSPVAVSRRLTDDLDAVSDAPSISGGDSSILGSPSGATDDADGLLGISSPSSVHFDSQGPAKAQQQQAQPQERHGRQDVQQQQQQQQHAQPPDQQLQRQLSALQLPGNPGGKLPGAETWIGGSGDSTGTSPIAVPARSAAGDMGRNSMKRLETVSSSLDAALAGLRGVAPLVSVRLQVLNDTPLNSARSATGSAATESVDGGSPAYLLSSAERRRASLEAASRAPPHQCDRSSWACKLGLCKLCNAKLATMGDEDDAPWLQPHVRVHFTVQGGVGECCCWRRAAAALAPPTPPPVYQHWVMLPDAPSGIFF